MKRQTVFAGIIATTLLRTLTSTAADIVTGDWETAAIDGIDASSVGAIYAGPFSCGIEKTGSGDAALPLDKLATHSHLTVTVKTGKLSITDNGDEVAVPATPPSALDKALFWVAADKNVVLESTAGVSEWYDVRESCNAGTWGNSYPAAIAVQPSWADSMRYPEIKTSDGTTGIWFGGSSSSGATMRFRSAADRTAPQTLSNLSEIFFVTKIVNGLGNTIGSKTGSTQFFQSGSLDKLSGTYLTRSASLIIPSGVNLLNGRLFDPFTTAVQAGTQLWNWHHPVRNTVSADYFFNDREFENRAGGDFLMEAVFFNSPLTLEERTQVENYLMRKWKIASTRPQPNIKIAKGAEAEIGTLPGGFTASGNGTLTIRNADAGTVLDVHGLASEFRGNVNVAAGALTVKGGALEAAALSGVSMNAVKTLDGGDFLVNAGTGKPGEVNVNVTESVDPSRPEGIIRFNTVAADITNITAKAQVVSFAAARELPRNEAIAAPAALRDATFTDPGFELRQGNGTFNSDVTIDGWTYSDLVHTEIYYNLNGGWWSDYIPPPEGKRAMGIKANGTAAPWTAKAKTSVTVHTKGIYELSFMTYGRYTTSMFQTKISLKSSSGETHILGAVTSYPSAGYAKRRYRTPLLEPGTYELMLDAYSLGDALANFDDFRLTIAPDQERGRVHPVPYGTFGNVVYYPNFLKLDEMHTYNTTPGWTLTLGGRGNLNSGCPSVGATSVGHKSEKYYNAGSSRYGDTQLTFWDGDGIAASDPFATLPEGKWRLRCRACRWGCSDWWPGKGTLLTAAQAPVFSASLMVNGTEHQLGTISPGSYIFSAFTFPGTVAVKSGDTVSVVVKQTVADAAGQLDDLEFVEVDDDEVAINGDFEESMNGWTLAANDTASTTGSARQQQPISNSFGDNRATGDYALLLVDLGSAEHELTFDEGGIYRLSFWARPRFYEGSTYPNRFRHAGNRIKASLIDEDGNVSEILTTPSLYETNFVEHTALFKVEKSTDAPRRMKLRLEGLNDAVSTKPGKLGWHNDLNVFIDNLTIRKSPSTDIDIPEDLSINLAEKTLLSLDFDGLKKVKEVRIGKRRLRGEINSRLYPEHVTGIGSLLVEIPGRIIFIR